MDADEPLPPLLVADGLDLMIFRSQEDLGSYIEPWFVDEPHRVWDARGRALELVAAEIPASGRGWRHRRHDVVRARLRKSATEVADCAAYLREWLAYVDGPELPADASLSDLLVQAITRGGMLR